VTVVLKHSNDKSTPQLLMKLEGVPEQLLSQQCSASGARYTNAQYVWWGKAHSGFVQFFNASGAAQTLYDECRIGR